MADQSCILGKSMSIRGSISGSEDLVVEGHVEGSIALASHLRIGETGTVKADVDVGDLTVSGALEGEIRASNAVALQAGSRVKGNMRAAKVSIDGAASYCGRIEMDVELPEDMAG